MHQNNLTTSVRYHFASSCLGKMTKGDNTLHVGVGLPRENLTVGGTVFACGSQLVLPPGVEYSHALRFAQEKLLDVLKASTPGQTWNLTQC